MPKNSSSIAADSASLASALSRWRHALTSMIAHRGSKESKVSSQAQLSQVTGTPLFEPDRLLIKFHNLWTIEAPQGYSLLFTHPANRFDLPFTTLTGLVDCDLYHDNWVHFPAHWHDVNFTGVLPKGTPVAQCTAVKRESWEVQTKAFTPDEAQRAHDLSNAIYRETGVYRKQFRA